MPDLSQRYAKLFQNLWIMNNILTAIKLHFIHPHIDLKKEYMSERIQELIQNAFNRQHCFPPLKDYGIKCRVL